jgi:hypothetical protein
MNDIPSKERDPEQIHIQFAIVDLDDERQDEHGERGRANE